MVVIAPAAPPASLMHGCLHASPTPLCAELQELREPGAPVGTAEMAEAAAATAEMAKAVTIKSVGNSNGRDNQIKTSRATHGKRQGGPGRALSFPLPSMSLTITTGTPYSILKRLILLN
ncbi:hypothetical protein OTU49_009514 [Cherax quadricarinatus]|uniref:Uncharacterized protein n=1 Tax=Cherax quadricarinatus TaxID=27406 RepID=A0AAW0WLD4_CHEQU